jgi:hypothetical protein
MVAENVKGRGNFEVVGIDGIILKWFLMCAWEMDCLVGFWKTAIKHYTITRNSFRRWETIRFVPWSSWVSVFVTLLDCPLLGFGLLTSTLRSLWRVLSSVASCS